MGRKSPKNVSERNSTKSISDSTNADKGSPIAGDKRKAEELLYYVCKCQYQATAFIDLENHVANNHPDSLPPPLKIPRTSRQMKSVPEEQSKPTVESERIKCELCDRTYLNERTLNVHIRYHNGEQRFKCTKCDYVAAWKSSLTSHQKNSKNGKLSYCTSCTAKFCTAKLLIQHVHDNHSNANSPAQVIEAAPLPTLVQHEQPERSGPLTFMDDPGRPVLDCIFCDFKAFDVGVLRRHTQEEHSHFQQRILQDVMNAETRGFCTPKKATSPGTPPSGYRTQRRCRRCNQTLRSKFDIEIHYKTCREKRFKCAHCVASFDIQNDLGNHLINLHNF